ncbi:hypothetical protein CANMA_004656 [Candida margitis]|uniref:uncharacterized protein n=1 Tax=Candida margitis TaxID=1775924 RepID=UPI002226AD0F|nr:uncharacterized protein CANMA_004656 [Candida margitis]KAI5953818.1 hypothetical protein CANMA_004656 [Candida margitis]
MRADIRRCRRCKRKRLDDEPMEVKQYKTCAKCRIIERNKKNSRKPLAKETMLYGLKQFREQQSTENYIEEEGLLKDEFFKRYHNKPFNYDAEIAKVLNDPNYEPPVITNITDEIIEASDVTSPNGTRYQVTIRRDDIGSPTRVRVPRAEKIKKPRQSYKRETSTKYNHLLPQVNISHLQQPVVEQASVNQPEVVDEKEELIGEILALGNGAVSNNASDIIDHANPYQFSNVYSNFEQYLQRILDLKTQKKNINNLVLLKEYKDSFPEEMSRFHADASIGDRNTENLSLNERQSRMNLLSNLKALYVDPIIASTSLPFEQKGNNLHDSNFSNEVRCYYQYKDRPDTDDSKMDLINSSIGLTYHKKYNILTIKFNLTVIDKRSQYPLTLKDAIADALKKVDSKTSDEDDSRDVHELVFEELNSSHDTFDDELKYYIKSLTLEKFGEVFATINGELIAEDEDAEIEDELEDEFVESEDDVEAGAGETVEGSNDVDDDVEDDEDDDNNNDNADLESYASEHLQENGKDEAVDAIKEKNAFDKPVSEVAAESLDPTLKL